MNQSFRMTMLRRFPATTWAALLGAGAFLAPLTLAAQSEPAAAPADSQDVAATATATTSATASEDADTTASTQPLAQPAAAAASPSASEPTPAQPTVVATPAQIPPTGAGVLVKDGGPEGFRIGIDGNLRVTAGAFMPDRFLGIKTGDRFNSATNPDVGRNDGFGLGGARLNLRASYGRNVYVRMGFDGAVASRDGVDGPGGELSTGLKDAYARFTFHRFASLFAGRFKPPFDVEELTPGYAQFFVNRALESRGVRAHEGPGAGGGFAPGRQFGVMLANDSLIDLGDVPGLGHVGGGYAFAITNGNSGDLTLNDNDLPAFWMRLHSRWGDRGGAAKRKAKDAYGRANPDEEGPATYQLERGGEVGVSTFYNEVTTGASPNRLNERWIGAGLDAVAHVWWFRFAGQMLWRMTDYLSQSDAPTLHSLGGHVQASLMIPNTGWAPGYRFAFNDPRFAPRAGNDFDRVMHHTLGVRYAPEAFPVVGMLDYTHSREQSGRSTPNDRVELAVQVTFR